MQQLSGQPCIQFVVGSSGASSIAFSRWRRIARILKAKRIRHTIEKGKQRRNVHRFGDLGICPPRITQSLRVRGRCLVGGFGHKFDKPQQLSLGLAEHGSVDVSFADSAANFGIGILQLQEECV